MRLRAHATKLDVMEMLTELPLALTLLVLALVDGLSIGTLLIPVFLLLAPGKVRAGRILLYLATICGFYLLVGILFSAGLVNLVDVAGDAISSTGGQIARLVIGAGLLVAAFLIPTKPREKREGEARGERAAQAQSSTAATQAGPAATGAHAGTTAGQTGPNWSDTARASADPTQPMPRAIPDPSARSAADPSLTPPPPATAPAGAAAGAPASGAPASTGRLARWRDRLMDEHASRGAVIAVALAAGVVEVATMLPYIAAMTMLAQTELDFPVRVGALVAYCLLMAAPAFLLLLVRIVAARQVEPPLQKLAAWLERTGPENTAWIMGIVGFLIARGAAGELGLFDAIDQWSSSLPF